MTVLGEKQEGGGAGSGELVTQSIATNPRRSASDKMSSWLTNKDNERSKCTGSQDFRSGRKQWGIVTVEAELVVREECASFQESGLVWLSFMKQSSNVANWVSEFSHSSSNLRFERRDLMAQLLTSIHAGQLVANKTSLVTASLSDTVETVLGKLLLHNIISLPLLNEVCFPPASHSNGAFMKLLLNLIHSLAVISCRTLS